MADEEQLRRAIDDLSEAEAAETLDGIAGAYDRAQRGLEQARAGQTTSLDDLERGSLCDAPPAP